MSIKYSVTLAVNKYANKEILNRIRPFVSIQNLGGEYISWNRDLDAKKIALAVDYLIRYLLGGDEKNVFPASRKSFQLLNIPTITERFNDQCDCLFSIPKECRKLSHELIVEFLRISAFDQVYRAGATIERINEDLENLKKCLNDKHIHEIEKLVSRSLNMFHEHGIPHEIGLYFSRSAFTWNQIVVIGDGDFMSKDTIWDLKVSSLKDVQMKDICQVICYWLLLRIQDKHELTKRSLSITKLALYNPRFNLIHYCYVKDLPEDAVQFILKNVIGYPLEL